MTVRSERQGGIGVLTLDRPGARNAVNAEMTRAIERALDDFEADEAVRVIVITGAGDKAFCAGADLKAFASGGADGIASDRGGFAGIVKRPMEKPLVAAVNGHAHAGGFEIVLACDLAYAAEHATFALPEVKRALIAGGGGTFRLPQRISLPTALEMILTGDSIDAHRAAALGLVNAAVPAERVMDEALAAAARIANNPPGAVRMARQLALRGREMTQQQAWLLSDEFSERVTSSADALEGARAFAEKRDPAWKR